MNRLAAAGFTNVYNVIDGMEGDIVEASERVFVGLTMKTGWKSSGLPWTYEVDPERVKIPAR